MYLKIFVLITNSSLCNSNTSCLKWKHLHGNFEYNVQNTASYYHARNWRDFRASGCRKTPKNPHFGCFFFLCTHRFASARHRTPSWSPHIARTSQWQRVANASGLLASAHFSARLRSSAGTPEVAGWRFSSTARDRKREQKGKKGTKTIGV